MKKCFPQFLLCFVGLLLLPSCTRTIVIQIFNATSGALEVVSYEKSGAERHYQIGPNQSGRVQVSRQLTVRRERVSWNYDLKPIPKTTNFFASVALGPLVVKLQVEGDGTLYVLPPAATNVMRGFPPQPDGYPIRPKQGNYFPK